MTNLIAIFLTIKVKKLFIFLQDQVGLAKALLWLIYMLMARLAKLTEPLFLLLTDTIQNLTIQPLN